MRRTQIGGAHLALRAGLASCVVFAGVAAGQSDALALQGGEDPALLPVLIDKRYGGENRHQLSLMFANSVVAKYTQGTGGYLAYQYNFIDMLGIEIGGGFFGTSDTSILEDVRVRTAGETTLPDMYAMQWTATANVVFVPIYGKMSFASTFDPAFDIFLLAGGGVVGTRRGFQENANGEPQQFETSTTWTVDVGGGIRFYIIDLLALRLEVRNWFYPEPANFQAEGNGRSIGGLTSVLNFQAGLQFTFGG